ncbi:MAG: DUF2778 domain-containing protein [Phycisphaerales bacterium]|nr:DUF2778 domain-containing protein [Phycisphaerales bacterium]
MTYYIAEARLTGTIGTETFTINAVSGGRAGSRTRGAVNFRIANNPLLVCRKEDEAHGIVGGPIPPGGYTMKPHPKHDYWIRLEPDDTNEMCNRDGFAIHGRGKIGSQGCIVPMQASDLKRLYKTLKEAGTARLTVVAGRDLAGAYITGFSRAMGLSR